MKKGIARHDGSTVKPGPGLVHQTSSDRIVQNVKTDFRKGVALPLFLAQNVIIGLRLEPMGNQLRFQVCAQKGHSISLIAVAPQPQPEQMHVIGHQAIGRTDQALAGGHMKQQLAKPAVE